jgi:2-polyprenyl-6-methoxyphenol hydroxylase-like FAD-dependent oxidoreductase
MKALVVGGGIGGLAAALSLHEWGVEVEVFEQTPEVRELGVQGQRMRSTRSVCSVS